MTNNKDAEKLSEKILVLGRIMSIAPIFKMHLTDELLNAVRTDIKLEIELWRNEEMEMSELESEVMHAMESIINATIDLKAAFDIYGRLSEKIQALEKGKK